MPLDDDGRYAALRARDPRFDGLFFVAVRTTGIYCRPICPARLPARENCTFFGSAAEAERHGYRPCLRCRPELTPGRADVDARSRLTRAAVERIDAGYLNEHGVEDLATSLGVSSRHLRRVLRSELGVSPVELAQTRRLAVAMQLLQDTSLPVTRVAFAAGFSSVRRFNAVFAERFSRPPSSIRREAGVGGSGGGRVGSGTASEASADDGERIAVRLDFRPPLAWRPLLAFLARRATAGIEAVDGETYRRFVVHDGRGGWIEVAPVPGRDSLRASIPVGLLGGLPWIVARLRHLLDLDARPDVVAGHLADDPRIGPLVERRPGLRVPGAFDPFELAVRTVLGQQISVEAASALCVRLVGAFGPGPPAANDAGPPDGRTFPTSEGLASRSVDEIRSLGMPASRATTIVELARAVASGDVELDGTTDPEETEGRLRSIHGIGPWTAQYLLMRAVRWPNAFPAADLGIRKALGGTTAAEAEARSRAWEPWRAYAALHLWNDPSDGGSR